jgi:hypothetical protein
VHQSEGVLTGREIQIADLGTRAVQAIVIDQDLAVDPQDGTIARLEAEGVWARSRH